MDLLGGLGIGAGLGLLKGWAIDQPKEARQRQLAAATQKYSPWTGNQAQPVEEASPFNNALQWGTTGAYYGNAAAQAAKTPGPSFPDSTQNLKSIQEAGPMQGFGGNSGYSPYKIPAVDPSITSPYMMPLKPYGF